MGDTLIVHFTNELGEPTTIHWHGVDTPANMDGSHISQKPIPDGGTFDYQFTLLEIGDVVLWEVNSLTHGDHPFHTHGFPFQWYETEYIDALTPANNFKENPRVIQNKDTVLVPARPGLKGSSRTVLRALMEIDDTGREGQIVAAGRHPSSTTSGGFLAHCHVLEHAASGMMTYFEVRDPSDPFANLGGGFPGPAGDVGYLSGTGTIAKGGKVTVSLDEAASLSLAFLLVGFSEANLLIDGGAIIPNGDLILGPFVTNATGEVDKSFNWDGFGSGFQLRIRYVLFENATDTSASNALRITEF